MYGRAAIYVLLSLGVGLLGVMFILPFFFAFVQVFDDVYTIYFQKPASPAPSFCMFCFWPCFLYFMQIMPKGFRCNHAGRCIVCKAMAKD